MAENDAALIQQALVRGVFQVPDAQGFQRFILARCPNEGKESPVYRTETSGAALSRVIFRCPVCGQQFEAAADQMLLR